MTRAYRGVGAVLYGIAILGTLVAFVLTLWPLIWDLILAILPL